MMAKDLRHTPRAIFQVLKKRIYSLDMLKRVILFYKTHSQAQPILEKTDAVKHDFWPFLGLLYDHRAPILPVIFAFSTI